MWHVRPQDVPIVRTIGTVKIESTDPQGGLFVPVPKVRQASVYSLGPKGDTRVGVTDPRSLVYQCPVSAISPEVWDLFDLWLSCHATGGLPMPGGWLDQPLIIRRVFPQLSLMEAAYQRAQDQTALATTLAALLSR